MHIMQEDKEQGEVNFSQLPTYIHCNMWKACVRADILICLRLLQRLESLSTVSTKPPEVHSDSCAS